MADIADGIEAAHILLLQEIDGIALAFREKRHQHIGTCYDILARTLHMQDGTLHHALEAAGRRWINIATDLQAFEFVVEILDHRIAEFTQVDSACLHHLGCIGIVD